LQSSDDVDENNLQSAVRSRMKKDFGFLTMAFDEFDANKDNVLSRDEVKAALSSINVPAEEAEQIFESIDRNHDGALQLEEWIENIPLELQMRLHEHAKAEYWRRLFYGGLRADDKEHWNKLIFGGLEPPELSRKYEGKEVSAVVGTRALQQTDRAPLDMGFLTMAFNEFDLNDDDVLSKEELRAALASINIPKVEADAIFASIDHNQDGSVQLQEWIENMSPELLNSLHVHAKAEYWRRLFYGGLRADNDEHWNKLIFGGLEQPEMPGAYAAKETKATVEAHTSQTAESFAADMGFLTVAFHEFDLNGDNVLSKDEMRAALASINITEDDADQIFDSMDQNNDEMIQLDEWIAKMSPEIQTKINSHAKSEYWRRLVWGGLRTDCDEHWNKLIFGGLDKSASRSVLL